MGSKLPPRIDGPASHCPTQFRACARLPFLRPAAYLGRSSFGLQTPSNEKRERARLDVGGKGLLSSRRFLPRKSRQATHEQYRPGATMQLGDQRASGNVEDRRGIGMVGGGLGVGGIVIALVAYFLGFDPASVLDVAEQVAPQREAREAPKGAPADEMGLFVSKVLGSTEDVWSEIFQKSGSAVPPADAGAVRRAGALGLRHGPGGDGAVLLSRRREALHRPRVLPRPADALSARPGDFAQAYVIAHEVGHHVQKLTGTFQKMEAARGRGSKAESNRTSVRMELQADCYAGVWGHHAGTHEAARSRRHRGGAQRRDRHRRRPPAEADAGPRRARVVHPRLVGAARALVQARPGLGQSDGLRHVLDGSP